ncbi:MAG: hypothetical protein LV473_01280 [Nitrospira sp.]|nr:hypothetical protein [Nitrospira sp.]
MMRSHVSRHTVCLIGLVTLIYSALLVMAAGCALTHADRSQNHQHHHSEEGSSDHNVLCVWACQATADAAEAIGSPPTVTELVGGPADLDSHRLCFLQPPSSTQTRAPPSIPFIRLG